MLHFVLFLFLVFVAFSPLKISINSRLGELVSLKRLDLGNNELTAVDEKLLTKMVDLRSLLLNANKLEKLPASIKFLTQLELLSVERNKQVIHCSF